MTHQSESQLEKTLVEQLGRLGFLPVVLERKDTAALVVNLRKHLRSLMGSFYG